MCCTEPPGSADQHSEEEMRFVTRFSSITQPHNVLQSQLAELQPPLSQTQAGRCRKESSPVAQEEQTWSSQALRCVPCTQTVAQKQYEITKYF